MRGNQPIIVLFDGGDMETSEKEKKGVNFNQNS